MTLLALGSVGTAAAYGPSKDTATPSRACAIIAQYGAGGYTSFADCMETINQDMRAYRFPADPLDPSSPLIGLDERCTDLENGTEEGGMFFQISYPFTFEEFPGWPFPVLTGYNHHQCEITLFTYHTLSGF